MTDAQIKVIPNLSARQANLLSQDALNFLKELELTYREQRLHLLALRQTRQLEFKQGKKPDFLSETKAIRIQHWMVAPIPSDLHDRRVEITGPVDRKMVINALNSDANVFMADFEDSNSPTWLNCIEGQINLYDAVRKNIDYHDKFRQKTYRLNKQTATLMVRPRGWHLDEAHVEIDGQPVSASLFDFALYYYHNAQYLLDKGSGPYFYLPKLESHLEARLWNQVFEKAQQLLNIPQGSIKATVLIETVTAAFEMDEILYELKDHAVGLNCGRWDYIFSFIKKFRNDPCSVLPDRNQVTMDRHFLKSYADLLIKTCHRRGAYAMGGMAAQIPIKEDELANQKALSRVYEDKLREAKSGHDGTWVAHPGLINTAFQAFDTVMGINKNQLSVTRDEVSISAQDLLKTPKGTVDEKSIWNNINVGLRYLIAWLKGNGCVPINHLMEDAATAEICRAQLWQWLKFEIKLNDDKLFNQELFENMFAQVVDAVASETALTAQLHTISQAASLYKKMILKEEFDDFLTLPAYELIKDKL